MPTLLKQSLFALFISLMTMQPVVAQIAPGVTQSAAHTANITGTVTQSDGAPVAGADVGLIGPAVLSTKSNDHGAFGFSSVPWGVYQIVVTSALGTTSRRNVSVGGDTNVAVQYAAQVSGMHTIAHLSTSSAGASINVTPASIASVNPTEYAFQGNTSWQQLLNQIPGVTVGGALASGLSAVDVVPGSPFFPIVLSINGALPYETSTTLDGMPFYNQSFDSNAGAGTDLAYLPLPAFDTADIVRGPGANAPSIVDSIGGSFVLHAPGQVEGNHFEFSMSNDPYGGVFSNFKATLRVGSLSATVIYGFNNSPGPLGTNATLIPALAFAPLTVNGAAFQSGAFQGFAPSKTYGPNEGAVETTLLYCCVPASTAWIQHNGALALSYNITPTVNAEVFYAGSTFTQQQTAFSWPVDFTPGAGYTGSISPGMHTYLDALPSDTEDIGSSSLLEERVTAYLGRGVLRVAALQNNTYTRQYFPFCYPDGSYTVYGTAGVGPTYPGTPMVFNGTRAAFTFFQVSENDYNWTNNRDMLASYATQIGSGSNIGISYVTSYYNAPDDYNFSETGFTYPASTLPASVSQTTNEVRLNAGTQVSDKLSLDASWYFAEGSYHVPNPATFVFGSNPGSWLDAGYPYNAPRLGATWQASTDEVIRAAAGGGFALPQLYDLVGSNGLPTCTAGICSVSLTNVNLRPEKSFGFDLGTDVRVHRDTTLSLDLYRTNLYGQLFESANRTGTYLGLPLYSFQYENLSQSRYEGVNFSIQHDVARGVYWHAALGLTRAYVVSVPFGFYNGTSGFPPALCTNCQNLYVVPGINFTGAFQSTVPYANGAASLGYRWAPGKYIDLSPTYYGKNNPYFQPAFVELDAHGGYAITKNVSILATFRNVTGVYDQNYVTLDPESPVGGPTVAGYPFMLNPMPYGPRSVIVTVNLNY